MAGRNPMTMPNKEWLMSNPTVIDYHHQTSLSSKPYTPSAPLSAPLSQSYSPSQSRSHNSGDTIRNKFNDFVHRINVDNKPLLDNLPNKQTSFGTRPNTSSTQGISSFSKKYDPFVEDDIEDMEISDDEPSSKTAQKRDREKKKPEKLVPMMENMEIKSGSAFYNGLILYIPPFEQLSNAAKSSPAMKMLYASFEFSFKSSIKIETKQRENSETDATVLFRDQIISTSSGWTPHIDASVRALELLSETCYTIQAKEDYFTKCKLVNGETMKTLNLKKWEAVSEKYPKLLEETKDSHIQKTFAVFLDNHTSSGVYEDIICCNLTRQDVNHIKKVVNFFQLTMLPCSISTNLSKKETPCVVSIHKYTSAKRLLDILIECGGENDNFRVYPPDTFKDFYKLHSNYWGQLQNLKDYDKNDPKTTLDDEELQALIVKPYENTISELFEKYKALPKIKKEPQELSHRKAGDDFMKEKLQIDMSNNKNLVPVERMQLLLKYMEQLQEYGSRVLTSGRPEMIKIYHSAIENLRKDLETCGKDIEKEQKNKTSTRKSPESRSLRKRTPSRRRSKSPIRRGNPVTVRNRSASPKKIRRSRSPKRPDRPRRSVSPRRRPRSRSPKRRPTSPRRTRSPARKAPSPLRRPSPSRRPSPPRRPSPSRRPRSPRRSQFQEDYVFATIFKDQFKRYVEGLRRFRIEIEDTPIERRRTLKDKLTRCQEQLEKFRNEASDNPRALGDYFDELTICKGELREQADMIAGKPGPNDIPRSVTPPWAGKTSSFETSPLSSTYPLPLSRFPYGSSSIPPPPGVSTLGSLPSYRGFTF